MLRNQTYADATQVMGDTPLIKLNRSSNRGTNPHAIALTISANLAGLFILFALILRAYYL